jgi:hypothetical protein
MQATSLVVMTPAASYDMTTLDVVKDELAITDTSADARLKRWITASSRTIQNYTRRVFAQETVVETFYQSGVNAGIPLGVPIVPPLIPLAMPRYDAMWAIRLKRFPVGAMASITVDGNTLDTSGYFLDANCGLLYRTDSSGNPVRWLCQQVVVTYTGGYADNLPPDLELACITLVRGLWFASRRDPSLRQISIPNVQEETYWVGQRGDDGAVPPEVAGRLDPYREVSLT